jgi:hypothetical protein
MGILLFAAVILFQIQARAEVGLNVPANVVCDNKAWEEMPSGNTKYEFTVVRDLEDFKDQTCTTVTGNAYDFTVKINTHCDNKCNSTAVSFKSANIQDCHVLCMDRSKFLDAFIRGYETGREACTSGPAKKKSLTKQ